ncbi:MAG: hypothetical protein HZB40_15995 [Rhodocyclales bacterium]|nr:hypothetical protein [Rhodocyclales bacterium]
MTEFALFGGSFAFVFAISLQQQNVHHQRFALAFINSAAIAALNLVVVKLGSAASPTEMAAYIAGQPMGTLLAMRLTQHLRARRVDRDSDRFDDHQNPVRQQ